jgi:hypothetical protein
VFIILFYQTTHLYDLDVVGLNKGKSNMPIVKVIGLLQEKTNPHFFLTNIAH